MPLGITQCYLPPGRGDLPAFTSTKLVLDLATLEGCKVELTYLAGYIPRWYTHPSTKRPYILGNFVDTPNDATHYSSPISSADIQLITLSASTTTSGLIRC